MSDPTVSTNESEAPSQDQITSGLFAHLVMQQSNMAMMLLGKTAHPETGEVIRDVEAAQLFIDLLEMIELKTKGNLNKQETALLKNALMATRMAFVESADSSAPSGGAPAKPSAAPTTPAPDATAGPAAQEAEEEHKKKFTKKY